MLHQECSRRGSLDIATKHFCPIMSFLRFCSNPPNQPISAQFCRICNSLHFCRFCSVLSNFMDSTLSNHVHFCPLLSNSVQSPVLSFAHFFAIQFSSLMPNYADSVRDSVHFPATRLDRRKVLVSAWTWYLTPLFLSAASWCRCRAVWWGIQSIADEDVTEFLRMILPHF